MNRYFNGVFYIAQIEITKRAGTKPARYVITKIKECS